MSDLRNAPINDIIDKLTECGIGIYIVAAAQKTAPDAMETVVGVNGRIDDIVELMASITRRAIDMLTLPANVTKEQATASMMMEVLKRVYCSEDTGVRDV